MSNFTNIVDSGLTFTAVELDEGVDFAETGDFSSVVIRSGFGEGGFGEGPFGGTETIVITVPTTSWTNIETP